MTTRAKVCVIAAFVLFELICGPTLATRRVDS